MPAKKPAQTAFGKRLVALRQARGLTQIELAKVADTTHGFQRQRRVARQRASLDW
jgi:transcriptional regulator with XRE-family HTH domain